MKKFLVIFYGEDESIVIPVRKNDDVDKLVQMRIATLGLTKEDSVKVFYRELEDCVLPEMYMDCLALKDDKLIFDRSHMIETNFDIWLPQREEIFKRIP